MSDIASLAARINAAPKSAAEGPCVASAFVLAVSGVALAAAGELRGSAGEPQGNLSSQGAAYCGRTGMMCMSCEVCVGFYHSFGCVGSCASNEACGVGEVSPCESTCKDRVESLMENGVSMDEAQDQIGKTFQSCACLVRPYCGNTGEKCSGGEVCLGYYKDWGCAGSCATNGACGPGEAAPCKSTCKDRVEDLMEAGGLSRESAMGKIAQAFSSECSCLA